MSQKDKDLWTKLVGRHNARKMREDVLHMQRCFPDTPDNEKIRSILMQLRRELESRMTE